MTQATTAPVSERESWALAELERLRDRLNFIDGAVASLADATSDDQEMHIIASIRAVLDGEREAPRSKAATTTDANTRVTLDRSELATVLAALRHWQQAIERIGIKALIKSPIGDILTDGETVEPLDADEIDALCEQINCGE